MGDASVPYALLKRVLYTCAQAGFRDVSLAVEYSSREFNLETANLEPANEELDSAKGSPAA
jgi:hypothetical protein